MICLRFKRNILNFYGQLVFHIKLNAFKNRSSIVYVEEPQDIPSKNIIFLFVKIDFVIVNSADPNEMPHYAAFYLALHRLPKAHVLRFMVFRGFHVIALTYPGAYTERYHS